jgi:type I restriction enzyme S subunit
MLEGWKTYKLSEAFDIIGGGTPKTTFDEYWNGDIPWLSVVDFNNDQRTVLNTEKTITELGLQKSSTKILKKGQLIISARGTVGKLAQLGRDMAFNQSCYGLTGKDNVLKNDYGYYLLKHSVSNIQANAHGSVFDTITRNTFENIEIPIPEIQEQIDIASILSALDDKIELNLQMNKTLEEMAMALYKHWFVDFGPFQNGEFVDSELGMIPKGWEVKRLGEILKIKHGYAFKGESFTTDKNQNLLLTPGNFEMQGGIKFNWGKQKFYLGEFPSNYVLKKGNLIIALTDLTQSCDILGAPAIIPDEDYLYLHNQRLGLVIDLAPQFSNDFIYSLANTVPFRAYMKNTKTGSTVSHTSPSRIYEYKIALPIEGISEILKAQMEELNNLKFLNLSENKLLTQTRDTLLPKLISGEVRVKDIKQNIAQVL